MSNRLGLSGAVETLSMSSISRGFANLKIAADKLSKEDASKFDDVIIMANDQLKKFGLHILLLKKLLENADVKMNQEEDEKLWERLESEFLSTMTLYNRLTRTLLYLGHLVDPEVQDVGDDKNCFEVELSASFIALGILTDQLKEHFSRLVSSKMTVENSDKEETARKWASRYKQIREKKWSFDVVGDKEKTTRKWASQYKQMREKKWMFDVPGYNFMDIKSIDILESQFDTWFHSLVVILFCDRSTPSWEIILPLFVELTFDIKFLGDDTKFFTVDAKDMIKTFNVESIPTVVVISHEEEIGRISIVETHTVPTFFKMLIPLLDGCLRKCQRQRQRKYKCLYNSRGEDTLRGVQDNAFAWI